MNLNMSAFAGNGMHLKASSVEAQTFLNAEEAEAAGVIGVGGLLHVEADALIDNVNDEFRITAGALFIRQAHGSLVRASVLFDVEEQLADDLKEERPQVPIFELEGVWGLDAHVESVQVLHLTLQPVQRVGEP